MIKAAAGHQAWSTNIVTTSSGMFPKVAVSFIVGIGGWQDWQVLFYSLYS